MKYLDIAKIVFLDLKRRKFSSALTFFAISLGILSIFLIVLISIGFENSIQQQFEQIGSNRLYVMPESTNLASMSYTKGLTDSEIHLIENKPYVKSVYPYYFKVSPVKYGNEYVDSYILGSYTDEQMFTDYNLKLKEGRFPRSNEKYAVVIGPTASEDLFSKKIPVGGNIYVKDIKFKVVGILEPIGSPQDDSQLYFNIDALRDAFDAGDNVGFVDVLIQEGYDVEISGKNLEIMLENKLGKDTIEVISPTQMLEQMSVILDIVKYTLGGIAFVTLIVGALGVINTMYVIITEKVRDIGIMKSIGATDFDILFLFMFQAGLFGFFGAVLGVIFGSLAAIGFEAAVVAAGYGFLKIDINYMVVLSLLLFGFVVGMLSGFLPAYKASKLNIIEAIRK